MRYNFEILMEFSDFQFERQIQNIKTTHSHSNITIGQMLTNFKRTTLPIHSKYDASFALSPKMS